MEHKTIQIDGVSGSMILDTKLNEGWVPDPVLMPTNRPNINENFMVYHLVKYSEEEKKALETDAVEPTRPTPEEIVSIVEITNAEGIQKEFYDKGYRVIPDKIYQKTSVMKLVKSTSQTKSTTPTSEAPASSAPV